MRLQWLMIPLAALSACSLFSSAAPAPEPEPLPFAVCSAEAHAALPSASIYQLDVDLETSQSAHTCLGAWQGHPVVVSMFYSSCTAMCPMIIEKMQSALAALPDDQRDSARALLVSFDPERDTPTKLAQVAASHGVDPSRWIIARAPESQARALSALLGISYRKLSNGEFDHSAIFTVLNADGVVAGRAEGLRVETAEIVKAFGSAAQ